ncbi:hypothetical protein [Celeribacter sp.]
MPFCVFVAEIHAPGARALETDKIGVNHLNRYIETDATEHEGL